MNSAFRTVWSFAGIMSVCYILTAASWVQVLLLFFAASIGWCLLSYSVDRRRVASVRQRSANNAARIRAGEMQVGQPFDEIAGVPVGDRQSQQVEQDSHVEQSPPRYTYRFPIHQLSNRPLPT